MSVPPPNNNDPYPFDFDGPPTQPPQPGQPMMGATPPSQPVYYYGRYYEEPSVKADIAEEIDDALGISNKLFGCGWWLLTLPFRIVWNVIEGILD